MSNSEDILRDLANDLKGMAERGYVVCKLCGYRFYGESLGEVLQALGEHGDTVHPKRKTMR